MNKLLLLNCFLMIMSIQLSAQVDRNMTKAEAAITQLIAHYAQARENQDTILLKKILTSDIDQLVSSGEWRRGIRTAVRGMQRSSSNNPGTRTLTVEKIRFLNKRSAIADARYVIENPDGTDRRMWSTFIVLREGSHWKIAAIRNMLPAK